MKWYAWAIVGLSVLFLAGCVRIYDGNGVAQDVRLEGRTAVFDVSTPASVAKKLVPVVKGSIYESGDRVSVFGTCLDADQLPIQGTVAYLSAWYPNGTLFFVNDSMTVMGEGRFVYEAYMEPVQGTYLTEFTCVAPDGQVALAWGEWQNPYWVARINDTQVAVAQVGEYVQDVLSQVNATYIFVNDSFVNVTQQIGYVAVVANASVDRNDSYLAGLLHTLLDTTTNRSLRVVTNVSDPVYNSFWYAYAQVFNAQGLVVGYPVVNCFVSTNNVPPSVNQTMNPTRSEGLGNVGDQAFIWRERVRRSGEWNYTITCDYS